MKSYFIAFAVVTLATLYVVNDYGAEKFGFFLFIFAISAFLMLGGGLKSLFQTRNLFDPGVIIGLFSVVFFLVSPLTQIANDYWPFIPSLSGEEGWFTVWGVMNLIGVMVYLTTSSLSMKEPAADYHQRSWVINPARFYRLTGIMLLFCLALQMVVYYRFGGISGFVDTYSDRQRLGLGLSGDDPLENYGLIFLFSESFKYILAMTLIYYFKDKTYAKSLTFFCLFMLFLFLVFLVFGGLRGSRSSTVFSLFFAAGMYHFWIRRLSIPVVAAGIVFLMVFLNAYYWYKISGTDGLAAMFNSDYRQSVNAARRDSDLYVMARDLGRMDIQVLTLREFSESKLSHEFGTTYINGIFTIIPKIVIPFKPNDLINVKSDIVFGVGYFNPDRGRPTTIVLGQFAEAYANFGYAGIIAFFAGLGLFVRGICRRIRFWAPDDARLLLLPVFCLLPLNCLMVDFGLLIMIIAKNLLVPFIVLFLSTQYRSKVASSEGSDVYADSMYQRAAV